ncbi:MAG: hypothetical protein RL112_2684 [Planctomycetota bacterium]
MSRASQGAPARALLSACAALAACAPEREAPAPVTFDEVPTRVEPAAERAPATEITQPLPRATERIGLVPTGLAEFDIQSLPPPLEDLREAAKRDIGPANADKELEKLRVELGERQP